MRSFWSVPRTGDFTPRTDTVRIVEVASWAPMPVWTGAGQLAFTGIPSPNRPVNNNNNSNGKTWKMNCVTIPAISGATGLDTKL